LGEFTGVASSLYDLVEARSRVEYRYGSTYFILFDVLLPVSISPERAEPLCQWYVRVYHPDVWRVGGGLAFFTAAEAFLNFWFFGPVIQFFVYGALMGMVYEYFRSQLQNAAAVFVYAMLLRWLFVIIRIDFASAMKSTLIFGLIPAAVAAFFIVGGRFVARTGQPHPARTPLPLVPRTLAPWQK
jgi:oligosaccharide repeat unit polymerase